MGRTARNKRDPRPVEHIELSGKHVGRRLAAAAALLLFGVGLIVYSLVKAGTPQPGWVTIEAGTSEGMTCGDEFSFLYLLGENAAAEQRAVTALYTRSCRKAYQLFHNKEGFEGLVNLYTINSHPNEVLEVEDALYSAFEVLEQAGSRALYLGPVYDRYDDLFFCTDDTQLVDFDPRASEAVRREYLELTAYANDPGSIALELLGDGKVRLKVSEEYLAYAQREYVDNLIDFSWMKNAFIVDYLAEELTAARFTSGAITSYDGFVRTLDVSGTEYSLRLFDLRGETLYSAAMMTYQGPMSIVSLRNYPVNDLDERRFYRLRTGEIRTMYLDPADGLCRSAADSLVCYSQTRSCGEVLAAVMGVYIADIFQTEELLSLAAAGGIQSVYLEADVIFHTDPALQLELYDGEGALYTASLVTP